MHTGLIDVWNAETFDADLMGHLMAARDLVHDYLNTDRQIFLSYDLGRGPTRPLIRPENPFAGKFIALTESLAAHMRRRTIRAWHYTRLTDGEVDLMRREGVQLSTPATLHLRLGSLVTAGLLRQDTADALYAASPFHSNQRDARAGKFWMTSHPVARTDGGVVPLMAHWGGEVASMWVDDPDLLAPLAVVGRPRVLELAVLLAVTNHAFRASEAIIGTFGRMLGCHSDKHGFDLYVTTALAGDALLALYTEGDPAFEALGRGYPQEFVDIEPNH